MTNSFGFVPNVCCAETRRNPFVTEKRWSDYLRSADVALSHRCDRFCGAHRLVFKLKRRRRNGLMSTGRGHCIIYTVQPLHSTQNSARAQLIASRYVHITLLADWLSIQRRQCATDTITRSSLTGTSNLLLPVVAFLSFVSIAPVFWLFPQDDWWWESVDLVGFSHSILLSLMMN